MIKTHQLLFAFLLFTFLSCKENKVESKINETDSTSQKVKSFISQLEKSEIKPTFSTSLDSVSIFDPNLKIKVTLKTKNSL
ncbi:hypothetical protein DRF58_14875 [Epilithonimonas hispanica]|uniref:Uncharacterized protein n=1 Tax=Epilithonimonas hispanica TaxID=358687 RepID=A0A3D9CPN7_9FLAO|nr:hypothetical protein DRF58_14875 [Epilithonimonas hispanica]